MKPMHSTFITIALATVLAPACKGRLDVGASGSDRALELDGSSSSESSNPADASATSTDDHSSVAATGTSGNHDMTSSGADVASDASDVSQQQSGSSKGSTSAPEVSSTGDEGSTIAIEGSSTDAQNHSSAPTLSDPNGWLDEFDPVAAVPSSSATCPVGPLRPNTECDSSGLVCGYEFEDNYQECTCFGSGSGPAKWDCEYATANDLCSEVTVEPGTDCYGVIGLFCHRPPGIECFCSSQTEKWECDIPESVDVPAPPEAVAPTTIIAEMTESDRETWCEWYSTYLAGGPGHLPIEDCPVEDGHTAGCGCAAQSQAPCRALTPALSVSQCMANLAVSECALPVSSLSACFETARGGACDIDEFACLDYLASPNCAGTIFSNWSQGGHSCDVQVE